MYIKNIENQKFFKKAAGLLVCAGVVVMLSGCNIFGFLFSPTGYEEKIPPAYNLNDHKGETIYIVVHATSASGSDLDLPSSLSRSVANQLLQKTRFPQETIIEEMASAGVGASIGRTYEDAEQRAQNAGADMLLYIEIREYDLFNVHNQDYYTGNLVTRSILMDTETKQPLWPKESGGRRVEASVELETKGRQPALNRLTAATAHCIVRELVPTPKTGYRCADERRSVEDLMKELE